MALVVDALVSLPTKSTVYFSKTRIIEEQLKEILTDLEPEDIVSIIFLYTHQKTNVRQIIELLENNPQAAFLRLPNEEQWAEKLLEILIITGNCNIIRKLGFSREEINSMKRQFVSSEHNVTPYLNRIIKSLYFLCKDLSSSDTKKLINKVNDQVSLQINVEKNDICLELCILQWLEQEYFTLDENNPRLENLIHNVKTTSCNLPVAFNFDCWKSNQSNTFVNKKDSCTQNNQKSDNSNLIQFKISKNDKNSEIAWNGPHKKLCIIINITDFIQGKFKGRPRLGSEEDEKNLSKTFTGCGFEIKTHKNLTALKMRQLLQAFNDDPKYKEYGCIFMCILSHGYEGAVIFSDDQDHISINDLENGFCCKNLENVFKCIILQACQGEKIGIIEKSMEKDSPPKVVADGLHNNPIHHKHYFLFQSTINTFMAFRDETEGSWFIQDICKVIREHAPIEINKWAQKVTECLSMRRGKTKHENKEVVQMSRVNYSLTHEYELPAYKKATE